MENTNTKETVEEFLARGGEITVCPPYTGPKNPITARPTTPAKDSQDGS